MKQLLALVLMTHSLLAFSGNGSSGGGNIFGDQLNPWFLQNTTQVEYCVEIAPDFSTIPRERILALVEKSFSFWKKTFSEYSISFSQDFKFEALLAKQTFRLSDKCTERTDLRFQLGDLTEQQKKMLPNHKQLMGIAFRTSYDEKLLKGQGFIYLAPEAGPLKPLSPKMHQTPWSYKKNLGLEYMLIHELGHVFGLQDIHFSSAGIMSAKFAELVTSKETIQYINSHKEGHLASPFGCNKNFDGSFEIETSRLVRTTGDVAENQNLKEDLQQVLGLPNHYKATFNSSNGLMTIKVDNKEYATINLSQNGNVSGGMLDPAITLYLTQKQRVYGNLPRSALNSHLEIYHVNNSINKKDDILRLASGRELKVFIQYNQACIPSIGTIHNETVYFDIFSGF